MVQVNLLDDGGLYRGIGAMVSATVGISEEFARLSSQQATSESFYKKVVGGVCNLSHFDGVLEPVGLRALVDECVSLVGTYNDQDVMLNNLFEIVMALSQSTDGRMRAANGAVCKARRIIENVESAAGNLMVGRDRFPEVGSVSRADVSLSWLPMSVEVALCDIDDAVRTSTILTELKMVVRRSLSEIELMRKEVNASRSAVQSILYCLIDEATCNALAQSLAQASAHP